MPLDTFSLTADEGGRKRFSWAEMGVGRKSEVSKSSLSHAGRRRGGSCGGENRPVGPRGLGWLWRGQWEVPGPWPWEAPENAAEE